MRCPALGPSAGRPFLCLAAGNDAVMCMLLSFVVCVVGALSLRVVSKAHPVGLQIFAREVEVDLLTLLFLPLRLRFLPRMAQLRDCKILACPFFLGISSKPVSGFFVFHGIYSLALFTCCSFLSLTICFLMAGLYGEVLGGMGFLPFMDECSPSAVVYVQILGSLFSTLPPYYISTSSSYFHLLSYLAGHDAFSSFHMSEND